MKKTGLIKHWGIAIAAGMIMLMAGCASPDDVTFARTVMNDLIAGRYTARHHIDWAVLTVMENSVGSEYVSLPNDKEKKDYECAFIDSFKTGFKAQNATKQSLVHWRLFNDVDSKLTYVAADNASGSYAFIFAIAHKDGKKKIVGIRMLSVTDRAKYTVYEEEQRHVLQKGFLAAQK